MEYETYLNQVVDTVYKKAAEVWTWQELAQMAGVSYSTVYRLGMRETRFPLLRTVFLLARAVNMDLPTIRRNLRELEVNRA